MAWKRSGVRFSIAPRKAGGGPSTTQVPEWLDLDKIVPPGLRANIPMLIVDAREVVAVIERFIRDSLPVWRQIDERIDGAHPGLDDWYRYMGGMTGLSEVEELIELAEWTFARIQEAGTVPDERAHDIIAKRLDGESRAVFNAFLQQVLDKDRDARADFVSGSASVTERERFARLAKAAGMPKQQDGLDALSALRPYGVKTREVDPETGF